MHDVYKNINYYNRHKARKILIVFDDMIVDMIRNKKLNSIVTELFIRKEIKYFSCFYHTTYFKVPKDVRLNTTHFFITKIPSKGELKQIVTNHSLDISPKDFINIYRKCTIEPYSFFVDDTTFASGNLVRFRKLFLKYNKNHDN